MEKIIGYRFDEIIETENASLNPNYKKIKEDIKFYLN